MENKNGIIFDINNRSFVGKLKNKKHAEDFRSVIEETGYCIIESVSIGKNGNLKHPKYFLLGKQKER